MKTNIAGKNIQILLATYNGEPYLREQLDSFLALDNYDRVKVLARDDGSTDGTLQILEEYEERHGFEIIRGENIGFTACMFELFRRSDPACAYFATSDQDDVWLPDKLSAGVRALEQLPADAPLLYGAATQPAAADLTPIGGPTAAPRGVSFYNAMVQNVIPGHTQILNRRLVDILLSGDVKHAPVIDWWIYLLASGVGQVIYDTEPHVLYRQHGGNAIGSETSRWGLWKRRGERLFENEFPFATKQLQTFLKLHGNVLRQTEHVREIEGFLNQDAFFVRLKYVFTAKTFRQAAFETLCFKLLFLFGRYNIR
ncbi:MAG: glycosyltransferase [Clostridiales Family XIII bacterium]|jgi:glycosyltransferase involved in cell wall biosynthesis|nr:glycosyltransferase [Clostridiales Family XIII bacterium]